MQRQHSVRNAPGAPCIRFASSCCFGPCLWSTLMDTLLVQILCPLLGPLPLSQCSCTGAGIWGLLFLQTSCGFIIHTIIFHTSILVVQAIHAPRYHFRDRDCSRNRFRHHSHCRCCTSPRWSGLAAGLCRSGGGGGASVGLKVWTCQVRGAGEVQVWDPRGAAWGQGAGAGLPAECRCGSAGVDLRAGLLRSEWRNGAGAVCDMSCVIRDLLLHPPLLLPPSPPLRSCLALILPYPSLQLPGTEAGGSVPEAGHVHGTEPDARRGGRRRLPGGCRGGGEADISGDRRSPGRCRGGEGGSCSRWVHGMLLRRRRGAFRCFHDALYASPSLPFFTCQAFKPRARRPFAPI